MHVRCVLFDLDGTLYDSPEYSKQLESEILKYVSRTLELGETETRALLTQRRRELGTLTRTIQSLGIDRNAFFQALADRISPSLYISRDSEVQETIRALREQGFKTGLVSNSGHPLVLKILDAIGLDRSLFDVIITSTEAEPKPSPQPFLLAMKCIGCDASEVVYVGDREYAEIRPARRFGLRTVLLNRDGAVGSTRADVVIGSLSEVPKVVRFARS